MVMSDEEICREYRLANNKRSQIGILADLNLCSTAQIVKVLIEGGEIEGDSFPNKKGWRWTPEREMDLVNYYRQGRPPKEIARLLGTEPKKVVSKLDALRLEGLLDAKPAADNDVAAAPKREVKFRWTPEQCNQLIKLYNEGKQTWEIAAVLGVDTARVSRKVWDLRNKGVIGEPDAAAAYQNSAELTDSEPVEAPIEQEPVQIEQEAEPEGVTADDIVTLETEDDYWRDIMDNKIDEAVRPAAVTLPAGSGVKISITIKPDGELSIFVDRGVVNA